MLKLTIKEGIMITVWCAVFKKNNKYYGIFKKEYSPIIYRNIEIIIKPFPYMDKTVEAAIKVLKFDAENYIGKKGIISKIIWPQLKKKKLIKKQPPPIPKKIELWLHLGECVIASEETSKINIAVLTKDPDIMFTDFRRFDIIQIQENSIGEAIKKSKKLARDIGTEKNHISSLGQDKII